jgi:uncharacterized protein (DUF1501 family)
MTTPISRRSFLKQSSAASAGVTVGSPLVLSLMGSDLAHATPSDPYRALVCVFLAGGNDAYDTVIRTDKGLDTYLAARRNICSSVVVPTSFDPKNAGYWTGQVADTTKMQLNQTVVSQYRTTQQLQTTHPDYNLALAVHPRLTYIKECFDAGKLAVIGNIGPLLAPVTAAQFEGKVPVGTKLPEMPPKLFSHNDQQSMWQSGKPEGSGTGWGGEMVRRANITNVNKIRHVNETVATADGTFSAVGIDTTPVFCFGTNTNLPSNTKVVLPYGASSQRGAVRMGNTLPTFDRVANDATAPELNAYWDRDKLLADLFTGAKGTSDGAIEGMSLGHLIEQDVATKLDNTDKSWHYLTSALGTFPDPTGTGLWRQLQMVAKIIKARTTAPLNMARQVFYVQLGGFDTHSGQDNDTHTKLLGELNDALKDFYDLLGTDSANVVTFTASDFGRKFTQNGDGTDHGWGGHHFVLGGDVKGGAYGHFPDTTATINLKSNGDGTQSVTSIQYKDTQMLSGDGTMVPKVSVDSLVYELGKWLGVDWNTTDVMKQILPKFRLTGDVVGTGSAAEPFLTGILPD